MFHMARVEAMIDACLEELIGNPAHGTAQLRPDLDRFVFLLGGSDASPARPGRDNLQV
jgi:hypothetical protein